MKLANYIRPHLAVLVTCLLLSLVFADGAWAQGATFDPGTALTGARDEVLSRLTQFFGPILAIVVLIACSKMGVQWLRRGVK